MRNGGLVLSIKSQYTAWPQDLSFRSVPSRSYLPTYLTLSDSSHITFGYGQIETTNQNLLVLARSDDMIPAWKHGSQEEDNWVSFESVNSGAKSLIPSSSSGAPFVFRPCSV